MNTINLSREINIGNIKIGGSNPVRIQSMCNTETQDVEKTYEQIVSLKESGCELVRLSVNNKKDVIAVKQIKKKTELLDIPLIADIHYNPQLALEVAPYVEKVRINPGNFIFTNGNGTSIQYFVEKLSRVCKEHQTAIRVGVNQGSLSEAILQKYGNTSQGMVQSALYYLGLFKKEDFHNVVVSLKSSDPVKMIRANIELAREMKRQGLDYPIHLGITEAGMGKEAELKSIIGIGALLQKGIGDTIRVSLTGDPVKEISVAKKLISGFAKKKAGKPYQKFNYFKNNLSQRKPIVISTTNNYKELDCAEYTPDFIFMPQLPEKQTFPINNNFILKYADWKKCKNKANFHPLLEVADLEENETVFPEFSFLNLRPGEVGNKVKHIIKHRKDFIIVLETNSSNFQQVNTCLNIIHHANIENKIVIRYVSDEHSKDNEVVKIAGYTGSVLTTGFGDGIWIESKKVCPKELNFLAFDILQVSGRRNIKTNFVACPTCGRTKFNLTEVFNSIKKEIGHISGLKIAIMGCHINGPGEMGEADYGIIGNGNNTVSLYRNHSVIAKDIEAEKATAELVGLLKKEGIWKNPQ
jgi:(E)-4-hydroxy-3-methylbut-2-enyl-diphosphate synthase